MGDAATPVLPNFTSQTATVYKTSIDADAAVEDRIAWAFAPHEQATPNMTVRSEAGSFYNLATQALTEVAAQNTGTITAPATNPRIDRVVVDDSGVVSVVTGTEAASPTPPAIPAGKFPICQVSLVVGQTSIANTDITDERTIAVGFGTAAWRSTASETAEGTAEIATQAETDTGIDDSRIVTPLKGAGHYLRQGRHTVWIPALAFTPDATNGPAFADWEQATNSHTYKVLDFDSAAVEMAFAVIQMPKSWDLGDVSFRALWGAAAGTVSQGVVFKLLAQAVSDDDPLNPSMTTGQSVTDALLALNDLHRSPESTAFAPGGTPVQGDLVLLRLSREVADAGDTLAADARLIGVELFLALDAGNDA